MAAPLKTPPPPPATPPRNPPRRAPGIPPPTGSATSPPRNPATPHRTAPITAPFRMLVKIRALGDDLQMNFSTLFGDLTAFFGVIRKIPTQAKEAWVGHPQDDCLGHPPLPK